ncbi:MAG: 1-deoxy-D-xylulose-5-phosphate synthase [Methylococcales bacterium]|nr:1-deoxy-D-xylulose-5-phosphate synthase [Methylococcales bacterium]
MNETESYTLLDQVNTPSDLKKLTQTELITLASELRHFLIHSVSKTGGHLAAGLGVVELTIALHSVFNTPDDRLVWDIGHQAYPHKILTGRKDNFHTIRQENGLAGFLKRDESKYDSFGAGHSSTSISAAVGMAAAFSQTGSQREVIPIIGDGALTAGMAYEALNHGGDLDINMLVILNDNNMSISANVGAMRKHLSRILSGHFYTKFRQHSKEFLKNLPPLFTKFAKNWEEHMKGMILPGTLFEELGFNYIGPIDGHDIPALIETLENLKQAKGRRLLHIVTQKGKGFSPAENNPCAFHGVKPFNTSTGVVAKSNDNQKTYSEAFGHWLCETAKNDKKLIAITPAMCEGSGMTEFRNNYADQFYDVGIAEQHALTFAAGLACEGFKPVIAIYSSFLQRAYDQLIHDIILQKLDVTFAIDRAGLVGADGPTHAGTFDISFLRCLPDIVIMAPENGNECQQMLETAYQHKGTACVRYPRGSAQSDSFSNPQELIPIGKASIKRSGKQCAILAFGSLVNTALEVAEKLDATVINMRFIKPLDEKLIYEMASKHETIVTLEENTIKGGAGSAVNEYLNTTQLNNRIINLGLPDHFVEHGNHQDQLNKCGLSVNGILSTIQKNKENYQ